MKRPGRVAKKGKKAPAVTGIKSIDEFLSLAGKRPGVRFKQEFKEMPLMEQAGAIRALKERYSTLNHNLAGLKTKLHKSLEGLTAIYAKQRSLARAIILYSYPAEKNVLKSELLRLNRVSGSVFSEFDPGTTERKPSSIERKALRAQQQLLELQREHQKAMQLYRTRH